MWFKSVEFWIYSERLESGFGRSAVICLSWGDSDDGVLSDRKQYEFGRCSHECRGFCQALDLMFNNEFNLMFGTWCAGLQIKVYCHFVFTIFLIFNLRILATLCGFVFLVLQVMNWHCAPWSTYIIQFTAWSVIYQSRYTLEDFSAWLRLNFLWFVLFMGPFSAPLCVLTLHIIDLSLRCLGLEDATKTTRYIL